MNTYRDPPHYLKRLLTTSTPKRLVWLDCSTRTITHRGMTQLVFEQAALGTTHYTKQKHKRVDTNHVFDNPHDLWSAIDQFCTKSHRVVLFCYDLPQQIRVSQAMIELPKFGWHLDNVVLEPGASWAAYEDDTRKLLMCDLHSWCPVPLRTIVGDVTKGQVKVLDIQAGREYHSTLCKTRCGLIRDAMLEVFAWIEGENLGPFRPTGSGQSYTAFRRRFMTHNLLVHDDTDRLNAERTAMWTGRVEAWRHGKLTGGPFVEYDMKTAYCKIAAYCDVPAVAMPAMRICTVPMVKRAMEQYAVLAHITVNTDIPVLPARVGGRTMWPTGTFDTWVWDPELKMALEFCNSVQVHRAYRYRREPALQEFAQFVLAGLGEQTQVYGLVPRRVLKHWSRCLVGRLGLRYRTWQKFATSDDIDLRLVKYLDIDEHVATDMLIAGHEWLLLTDMHEGAESLPQIPSWVMSMCRRQLWYAMMRAGLGRVVYCDTDSMICTADQYIDELFRSDVTYGTHWTMRGTYERVTIHGPRNLVLESDRRISGIPLTARQTAPLEFTGEVMRSIKDSMRAGELDRVTSIPRTFVLGAPDLRRQHMPDGTTQPYHVEPITQEED